MSAVERMKFVAKRRTGAERGSALILVTASITILIAFAIIAIDGPILLTTKGQLQAAADAAALAGASGLLEGSQDLAVQRAIEYAGFNIAVQDMARPVIISAADISFPQADIIRVETHRTEATGDALRTYFRRLIVATQPNTADVTAVAMAQAQDICGAKCLKPWAVPDRWVDANGNNQYDTGEYYETGVTSYQAPQDVGLSIVLKLGNEDDPIAPGQFFPVAYPPLDYPGETPNTGGEWYRTWIEECTPYTVGPGDRLLLEPGNKTGPTRQGVESLIAQDPGAHWDAGNKTVAGSAFGLSPRIALVPFFDPTQPPQSGRNWVRVAKVAVIFIEQISSDGQVSGRFMSITTPGTPCAPGAGGAPGTFLKGVTLIS